MATCDTRSRERRIEVEECGTDECIETGRRHVIKTNDNEDYRAIQEIVRRRDSDNDVRKHILEKFGERGSHGDIKAREIFNGGCTKAQINCCIGHNPHGRRENLIDDCKGSECPRCGVEEDWNHVLLCPGNFVKNKAFVKNMRKEIGKIKTDDVVRKEEMVEDIEDFLNGNDRRRTLQRIVGINMIFRRFIIKNWHNEDTDRSVCLEVNKKLISLCVAYYWKCWEERNEVKFKPDIRRNFVVKWDENQLEQAKMSDSVVVRRYVRECEIQVENRSTDQIQRWLIGLNVVIKRAKAHNLNDMRQHVN